MREDFCFRNCEVVWGLGNEVGGGLADPDIRHSVRTVDPEMKHIHCNLELSVQITNDSDANVELFLKTIVENNGVLY